MAVRSVAFDETPLNQDNILRRFQIAVFKEWFNSYFYDTTYTI